MNRFDRHIVFRLLSGFAALVAVLIVFFIVLHYVEFIDDFLDRGATMREVFLVYYPNYIPEIARLTAPLALFLSCVYLTGHLSQSLQLSALQTSGVSLYRLLVPYLATGIAVTACMFWFNGWIVPETNRTVLEFELRFLKDAPRVIETNNIHRQHSPGSYISVGYYDRRNETAHRISLQHFNETNRLVQRVDGVRMSWIDSLSIWQIHQPVVRTFSNGVETRQVLTRIDTALTILPRDLARTERDVESMTIPAAARYIRDIERSGAGGLGRTQVGYYAKFAWPFANLILVLIGMPLAAIRRRGGQAMQMGIGLFVAFLYLTVQKITEPLGYTGVLPPSAAVWLPHALFLAAAVFLLARVRK